MTGISLTPSHVRLRYIALAILPLGAVGFTGTPSLAQNHFFQPYFGRRHPLLAVSLISVLGIVSLHLLYSRDWFEIYADRASLSGVVLSGTMATLFAIPVILVELSIVFPYYHVPPPQSLLFYPAMAYVAVIVLLHCLFPFYSSPSAHYSRASIPSGSPGVASSSLRVWSRSFSWAWDSRRNRSHGLTCTWDYMCSRSICFNCILFGDTTLSRCMRFGLCTTSKGISFGVPSLSRSPEAHATSILGILLRRPRILSFVLGCTGAVPWKCGQHGGPRPCDHCRGWTRLVCPHATLPYPLRNE